MRGGGEERREREKESEVDFALGLEPNVGLNLTTTRS